MTISEALATGLQTTVLGMLTVFAVLVIIMSVLYVFAAVFGKKNSDAETKETVSKPVEVKTTEIVENNVVNEEELIAVLTAAVAASLNTSTYNLQIKSYRRVGNSKPSWNRAGVTETINNRF